MAIYAIGDVHGCMRTLEDLLCSLSWNPASDRLWMVGDLLNRGPDSLETLRWAVDLERKGRLTAVLGNHDLALLACFSGARSMQPDDTFHDILSAPDADRLCDWLRRRPLMLRRGSDFLVHAGVLPGWSPGEAHRRARRAERRLAADDWGEFLKQSFQRRPGSAPIDKDASALSVLTRIRLCDPTGRMVQGFTGPPEDAPDGARPWFALRPERERAHWIFGHWAALGLRLGDHYSALDDGCVYGRALAAIRLEDRTVYRVESRM